MKNWRRYEILLPLCYNDGTPVSKSLLARTIQELEERFGAVSCETQIISTANEHQAAKPQPKWLTTNGHE
jgi:hypothetical protein